MNLNTGYPFCFPLLTLLLFHFEDVDDDYEDAEDQAPEDGFHDIIDSGIICKICAALLTVVLLCC